jgi:rhamnose transport system ATP-binding protein
MAPPVLSISGVSKAFGGVRALTDARLDLYPGEVTALIGENGAGKSTLVKILTGVHAPDGGDIRLDGEPIRLTSPTIAQRAGISVIHQEQVVFDDLTVAENILIGDPPKGQLGIDWKAMRTRATAILQELECDVDPDTPCRRLSVAQKHRVQIARALAQRCRIVIMDEPTAALSHREAEDLFRIIRRLKAEGRAVLFISHRFEEVFALCDRYAVFRDGAAVGEGRIDETDVDGLIRMMVGRPLSQIYPERTGAPGAEALRVEGLSRDGEFADVSFDVRKGEVLGVYGLVGAGRSEVMQALFGMTQADAGRVTLEGQAIRLRSPAEAIRAGVAYASEDRQREGAIPALPIRWNIALPSLDRRTRFGLVDRRAEREWSAELARRLAVKAGDINDPLETLSGGNQQKVVLAKWLGTEPKVLIVDEPTRGIDVGSKAVVHGVINDLAASGLAVVMVSSDLPEVLAASDRVLVMRRGRVAALLDRAEATPEALLRAATDA